MLIRFSNLSLVILGFFLSSNTLAMPRYGDWWDDEYPNSGSGGSNCQLCHSRADGGNGWNYYGWSLRQVFRNSGSAGSEESRIKSSLRDIEDFTDNGYKFIDEINANSQPGWTEGTVNLTQDKNGNQAIVSPPMDLPCGVLIDQNSTLICDIEMPNEPILQGTVVINLEEVTSGLTDPVLALSSPDVLDNGDIFVVERSGLVWRVDLATGNRTQFLDFSSEIINVSSLGERGLLGFVFDPNYAVNRLVYTYLSKSIDGAADFSTLTAMESADHQSVISKWEVVDPRADQTTVINEVEMLKVDQPQANHNAGDLHFGPDNFLYIAFGDGGSAFDQGVGHGENGNGRDNENPLGAILRIDPHSTNSNNGRYGVPMDNPFVGVQGLDEIYAYGFRNPYRFSIDVLPNNSFDLYVGDVGQNNIEEVSRISSTDAGGNFGWNYKEGSYFLHQGQTGSFVSDVPPTNSVIPTVIDPIAEYDHSEGISVIGGHVYIGSEAEGLGRSYVFGEYGSSKGRVLYLDGNEDIREFQYENSPNMRITGFGKDSQGEIYIVRNSLSTGEGVLKKITTGTIQDMCFPIPVGENRFSVVCL